MIERILPLPALPQDSFFLWGPRKTGKSTLLATQYPNALRIDLLKTDLVLKYSMHPHLLREELEAMRDIPRLVVIDEIQKVPSLLDEVHYLIEQENIVFGLCGSSARKVKRGHANLLGGRAVRYELFGLSAQELGTDFSLNTILNRGYLPSHYLRSNAARLLRAYVNDYLKEEILDEGLTRNLPIFSRFLEAAAITDTEIVKYTNIASDCGVSITTVKGYYSILEDTLLGRFLPSFVKRPKRKVTKSPKFYFADVGVVNHLCKRGAVKQGSEVYGKAFENWLFHEISLFREYRELFFDLSYWRLSSGGEVDFILGDMEVAVEAKGRDNIGNHHLKGLRDLRKDHSSISKLCLVCLEKTARKTEDGILILPVKEFIERLWSGEIVA